MRSMPIAGLIVIATLAVAPSAHAADAHTDGCTGGPSTSFDFSGASVDSRPTNVVSARMKGPGTIAYSKTVSATASAAMSASVATEANAIFAKASTTFGVTLTASKTWTDGFSYTMQVPAGQTLRMQLFEESRSFFVRKYLLNTRTCSYERVYNESTNVPLKSQSDEWKLVP